MPPLDGVLSRNELKPQLLGIHALNSLAYTNSASRGLNISPPR